MFIINRISSVAILQSLFYYQSLFEDYLAMVSYFMIISEKTTGCTDFLGLLFSFSGG